MALNTFPEKVLFWEKFKRWETIQLFMGFKKKGSGKGDEVTLRRDKLDPATCREFGGAFDEDGKCVLNKRIDPNDPDAIIFKRVNYIRSDNDRKQREEY